ncbi:MAG: hypothetical protein C0602_01050 [Denitrovibrio sp.]|nr:MAG: hypothetical protein C0602_01050 [Denitrovibrio sp.]
MFKEDILYGGHEELKERIKQLKAVVNRCSKHGDDAHEHVTVIVELVNGMESILDKYSKSEAM